MGSRLPEIIIILVILALFLASSKLPKLAKTAEEPVEDLQKGFDDLSPKSTPESKKFSE